MLTIGCILALANCATPSEPVELSFDIWDWTAPAQDLETFDEWVGDLARMGFTRVELSVPWRVLEPEPNQLDLTWLADRLAVCKKHGVGLRTRINSYYGGATPDWYDGATWRDVDDNPAPQSPPSILDETFWKHYGPLCTAIAALCKGEDVLHNAFIGIHAELKFADWWSYDEACMAHWREAIAQPRPDWLNDVVDPAAPLPERPPLPQPTVGLPDTSPASRAFIAFREWAWRDALRRFNDAIHAGDPHAKTSAPLGESYRIGSAQMSNLDYWGLSRGADQVVHSYDFFWHGQDGAWEAGAAVNAFRGITGLPVCFEYDAEESTLGLGYSIPHLLAMGRQAARAGAGLKVANYSYQKALPSEHALLPRLVEQWRSPAPRAPYSTRHDANRDETVLLFFSKWTNYSYREPAGKVGFAWVHDTQFGVYKLFQDLGIPTRIICEDNLTEDLSGYRALFLALSPPALMLDSAQARLAQLEIPKIWDYREVPPLRTNNTPDQATGLATVRLTDPAAPIGPADLSDLKGFDFALEARGTPLAAHRPGEAILGYPIGLVYQTDDAPFTHQGLILWALGAVTP